MKIIDVRSDTVTRPSQAMLSAMMNAKVGDDGFGDDPTVNALEARVADMFGKEAAVFTPSGTQSNLMSLMSHCARGDEYIVGQEAHTYKWEGGGGAVLGSIQPQPIDFEPNGTLALDKVKSYIKPVDDHHAQTRLLCIENTQAGKALPMEYLRDVRDFCTKEGLASHLDGARVFNAAIHHGVSVKDIACNVDSVSFCLSKGLGAPVGSLLVGPADFIKRARRWRKALGGGMRQAGVLAAAGLYALDNNIERLAQDHANAALLTRELQEVEEISMLSNATNMVFFQAASDGIKRLQEHLEANGILTFAFAGGKMRMVMHLGITRDDVLRIAGEIKNFFAVQ